jgi:ABC-type antimicrobial peptide transport system permease subunit
LRVLRGAAALALALAAVGVYGVTAYLVRQRTHEFGVRSALGAAPGVLVRSVIAGALRLTLVGVAIGLLGVALLASALPARRAMAVSPTEALRGG